MLRRVFGSVTFSTYPGSRDLLEGADINLFCTRFLSNASVCPTVIEVVFLINLGSSILQMSCIYFHREKFGVSMYCPPRILRLTDRKSVV